MIVSDVSDVSEDGWWVRWVVWVMIVSEWWLWVMTVSEWWLWVRWVMWVMTVSEWCCEWWMWVSDDFVSAVSEWWPWVICGAERKKGRYTPKKWDKKLLFFPRCITTFFSFPLSQGRFFAQNVVFCLFLLRNLVTSCNEHFSETVQMKTPTFRWKIEQIGEKMTSRKWDRKKSRYTLFEFSTVFDSWRKKSRFWKVGEK